jgi:hypothetical protein
MIGMLAVFLVLMLMGIQALGPILLNLLLHLVPIFLVIAGVVSLINRNIVGALVCAVILAVWLFT